MNYKKVFVEQLASNDCGCACLAMLSNYYAGKQTLAQVKNIVKPNRDHGASFADLANAAKEMGFAIAAIQMDKTALDENFTLPAIVHMKMDLGKNHYVLLYKITAKKVTLLDPAIGKLTLPRAEFEESFDGAALLACPVDYFYSRKKENESKSRTIAKDVKKEIFKRTPLILLIALFSLLSVVLGIAFSFSYQSIIDSISAGMDTYLKTILIAFGVVSVLKVITAFASQYSSMILAKKTDIPVANQFYKKLFSLPSATFDSMQMGDVLVRCQDLSSIEQFMITVFAECFISVPTLLLACSVMVIFSPQLAVVSLGLTALSCGLIFVTRSKYASYEKRAKRDVSMFSGKIYDIFSGVGTIKHYGKESFFQEKIDALLKNSAESSFKTGLFATGQTSVVSLLFGIGNVFLLGISSLLIANNLMTVGQMVTFFTLSSLAIDSVGKIASLLIGRENYKIALSRLSELYFTDEENVRKEADPLRCDVTVASTEIKAEHVSFGFSKSCDTIKDVSLTIPAGSKVAFVGESGSGKTTMAKLIAGEYPFSGEITFAGDPIDKWDKGSLMKHFNVVEQKPMIFKDSVLNNILMDQYSAESLNKLKKILEDIGSVDLKNYDDATELSGGEKQKLAVIRAALHGGEVYILDEATSNMDSNLENQVMRYLMNEGEQKTIIAISHRLNTVKNFDRIYFFDHGQVVESGTHQELLNLKGKYYQLWMSQMQ